MRPVSVRFACFGPYMQEQFVDFEALEKSGLFLICGETGAGKTTILDAICYALYGRSSGGLRGGLEVMRCALATSEDDTLVEFVFDSNGKRYKFTRSLKFRTGKNKKSKNLNDYHNCLELDGEREIPIVEKEQDKYVTRKAEELIGLTYDQFRQVIILPQGQFERLLVSPSEEKETILVSLFHAERWQKIAEELQRRVAEQDKALKEERRTIDEKLRSYDCSTLEQLEEKKDSQRSILEDLLRSTREAELALQTAKQEKERALLDDQLFQEMKRREARLTLLKRKEDSFRTEAALLEDADRAEAIRAPYSAWRSAVSAELRAQRSVQESRENLAHRQQALEKVRRQQREQEEKRWAYERDRQKILMLQTAREVYTVLEQRQRAATAARREAEAAQREARRVQSDFDRCAQALEAAMQMQNQAMQRYQTAQKQYLQGIGATLARELRPGDPCPVCGSREHPEPAVPGGTQVTDAQLDDALQQMNAAGARVSEALEKRTASEQKNKTAQQTLTDAQRRADLAQAALEEALSQRLKDVETEAQRLEMLSALENRVSRYEEADKQLQLDLTAAMGSAEAAKGLLEAALQEQETAGNTRQEAQQLWEQALSDSGLDSEQRYLAADLAAGEKQKRKTALHQFYADLENSLGAVQSQQELLEGKLSPDLALAEARLREAENRHRSCVTTQTLAAKQLEDMVRDSSALQRRLKQYEKDRLQVDADLIFARRLRGDSGISLQRYVLGVMLTSVTTEANRLLAGVYGGRYRLFRTDEIAGRSRKGGLELEVYDSQTSQRRSVTTLSGGEKFLVALSLAIGLSTVVQAQGGGVRLEAMFVDEGFGSLDRESVGDALEVLQGIRRGCGIVGIISHVEQLAEVIPTRLEITKGKQGSRCTLRG